MREHRPTTRPKRLRSGVGRPLQPASRLAYSKLDAIVEAPDFPTSWPLSSSAGTSGRREETAAARSQANTARLLAEHPVLMRMKELESLEEILRGTRSTFVFGTGDLTAQMKTLVASRPAADE